jgi:NADPH:quinone reductase-like Zn-dependent oxidoreductase
MKAVVRTRYGSPDVLAIREVEVPRVGPDQVLVRVHASSVNAYDWHMLRGKPYFARLTEGLRRPKDERLGLDVAGVVEAVGRDVAGLRPGDRVFGSRSGAFAEWISGRNLAPIPAGLTFTEAAALPTAGFTALQGLRDQGEVRTGDRVLILGAGGGVGTMAVQIACALGATVTAVTRTAHLELMRSLGAIEVIDYTRDEVTLGTGRYDVILDIAGTSPLSRLAQLLREGGRHVMVAPDPGQWIGPIARVAGAVVRSRFGSRRLRPFLSTPNRDDLLVLKELVEAGKLRPVIDRTYPLEGVADAIRYVEEGRAGGKVVIEVGTETPAKPGPG